MTLSRRSRLGSAVDDRDALADLGPNVAGASQRRATRFTLADLGPNVGGASQRRATRFTLADLGRKCREERGMAGVEMLPTAILVFIVGSIIIINAWTVIDSWMAVSTAAREGARVYVESDPGDAWANASERISDVMADYGRDERAVTPSAPGLAAYERCAVVTITVGYEVAFITVPLIGAFGSLDTIEASHSERIDPYRSGDFEGTCT